MPITIPTVEIELDKVRHLRFDFNAICDFEDKAGKEIMSMMITLPDGSPSIKFNFKDLRILLWAALKWEDPALTLEQVGAQIYNGNAEAVGKKIAEALNAGLPPKKEGEQAPN